MAHRLAVSLKFRRAAQQVMEGVLPRANLGDTTSSATNGTALAGARSAGSAEHAEAATRPILEREERHHGVKHQHPSETASSLYSRRFSRSASLTLPHLSSPIPSSHSLALSAGSSPPLPSSPPSATLPAAASASRPSSCTTHPLASIRPPSVPSSYPLSSPSSTSSPSSPSSPSSQSCHSFPSSPSSQTSPSSHSSLSPPSSASCRSYASSPRSPSPSSSSLSPRCPAPPPAHMRKCLPPSPTARRLGAQLRAAAAKQASEQPVGGTGGGIFF
ncbi:unnamed protein product [Closterium sp. Naga37s-1]|nr:unnamed protein product [Closterium sp. Naga37s-1]